MVSTVIGSSIYVILTGNADQKKEADPEQGQPHNQQ